MVLALEYTDWVGIGHDTRCADQGGVRYCETITSLTSCIPAVIGGKFYLYTLK